MGGAESTVVAPVDDPERDGMGEVTPVLPLKLPPPPPPPPTDANVVVEVVCWCCCELLLNQDSDIWASSFPLTPVYIIIHHIFLRRECHVVCIINDNKKD